jgi:2,3-bisphosphoglycerate-independent phosphoglycerate mutase
MNRAVMIFVDGMGMGSDNPDDNPIHRGACPSLEKLLKEHAVPADASLGVPGLPQSATGTSTILTGINTAQIIGRHVEGFPGHQLKDIIKEHNIFRKLATLQLTSTFANAYFVDEVSEVEQGRLQSVTTVAALSAFGRVRDKAMLERNEAVYQDLTRQGLRARGYTGPLVTPAESARHLVALARGYHFTLFEYFQTDRAGHSVDPEQVRAVLSLLDEFLGSLLTAAAEEGLLIVLTSDHGNIEDSRTHRHTNNPVPFVAVGPDEEAIRKRVRSIADVTPTLVEWLSRRE